MSLNEMLFIAAGVILGVAASYSHKIITKMIFDFKVRRFMKKDYDEQKKKLEQFKKDGGIHKWVNGVSVRLPNGEMTQTHACEHTGYCPALEGFLDVNRVRAVAEGRRSKEEFEDFKEAEINKIQEYFSIPDSDIEELVDRVLGIGTRFQLQKAQEFKEKLQKQFGKDVRIVTNIDELNEALKGAGDGKSK